MAPSRTERLTASEIVRAVEILVAGGTVAIPTETVYGLAADAGSDDAVAGIFTAKGRPAGHPLIVHLASIVEAAAWADMGDGRARKLAEAFWPGPLTLVLPRTERVSSLVVGGRSTIGLRVPSHPVARAVLVAFGRSGSGGVAAPSANRFGHVSPTTAAHVLADLDGRIDAVIDGGAARIGVESTIVEIVGPQVVLLRPGGVSAAQIESVLGEPLIDGRQTESRAAGMLASHYAPRAVVEIVEVIDPGQLGPRTGVIGPVDAGADVTNYWPLATDAGRYAEGLYDALRSADDAGMDRVLVVPPTTGEMLDAVIDRLTKAAAARPGD